MKKLVRINGNLRKVFTIGELAAMIGRSTITLRKYEERGILPVANFRLKGKQMKDGTVRNGERIYTEELCRAIKEVFSGISQGVQVTEEQKQYLREAFYQERAKNSNNAENK